MLTWLHRDHYVRVPSNVRNFVPQHLVYLDASASMHLPDGKTESVCDWDADAWNDWRQQSVNRSAPCWVHIGKKVLEKAVPLLQKSSVECAIFGDGPSFRLQYLPQEFEGHLEEVSDTWARSCLGGTLLWQRIARDIDRMFPGEPAPGETRETKLLIITDGYDTESKALYRGLMGCRQLAQDLVKKKVDAEIHIISLGVEAVEVVNEYQQITSWSGGECYAVNDIQDHAGLDETMSNFGLYVLEDSEQRQTRRTAKRALFFHKYGQQKAYPVNVMPGVDELEPSKSPSRAPSPFKSNASEVHEVPSRPESRAATDTQSVASRPQSAAKEAPAADTQSVASRPQSAAKHVQEDYGGPRDTGEVKSLQEMAQAERLLRMKEMKAELAEKQNSINGPNSAPPAQQVHSSTEQQHMLSTEADRLRTEESTEPLEAHATPAGA